MFSGRKCCQLDCLTSNIRAKKEVHFGWSLALILFLCFPLPVMLFFLLFKVNPVCAFPHSQLASSCVPWKRCSECLSAYLWFPHFNSSKKTYDNKHRLCLQTFLSCMYCAVPGRKSTWIYTGTKKDARINFTLCRCSCSHCVQEAWNAQPFPKTAAYVYSRATLETNAFWDGVHWVSPLRWTPTSPSSTPPNILSLLLDQLWDGVEKRDLTEGSSEVSAAHPSLSSHWAHKLVLTPPGRNNKHKRRTLPALGSIPITEAATAEPEASGAASADKTQSLFSLAVVPSPWQHPAQLPEQGGESCLLRQLIFFNHHKAPMCFLFHCY